MAELICTLINIYVFVIIIRLFMSWVPPTPGSTYQTIYDGFVTVTEPVLAPVRSLVGNFTTSLDMAGASLTVTLLDDELKALWDAPVHTPALRW